MSFCRAISRCRVCLRDVIVRGIFIHTLAVIAIFISAVLTGWAVGTCRCHLSPVEVSVTGEVDRRGEGGWGVGVVGGVGGGGSNRNAASQLVPG